MDMVLRSILPNRLNQLLTGRLLPQNSPQSKILKPLRQPALIFTETLNRSSTNILIDNPLPQRRAILSTPERRLDMARMYQNGTIASGLKKDVDDLVAAAVVAQRMR